MATLSSFKGSFYFNFENENGPQKLELSEVKLPTTLEPKTEYGLMPNLDLNLSGDFKINQPKAKIKFPKKLRRARKNRCLKKSGKNF